MILGEEHRLLWSFLILTKKLYRATPRGFLSAIEFAKVKDMALGDTTVEQSAIFDRTSVVVSLAIFNAFQISQKHNGCIR